MPQTDSKPGETNRPSYRQQIIRPTLAHTDASNTQATNHMDTNKITGNKYYVLPWLIHIPEIHGQQKRHLDHASHIHQQITGKNRTSYHASDTSKSQATKHTKSQAILPTNRTSCHASRCACLAAINGWRDAEPSKSQWPQSIRSNHVLSTTAPGSTKRLLQYSRLGCRALPTLGTRCSSVDSNAARSKNNRPFKS